MIMIFAAAAQARVSELTNSVGLRGQVSSLFGSGFFRSLFRRSFWKEAGEVVGNVGLLVMDVGSLVVNAGWRIVLYGFFAWAGSGLVRNLGRLVGVVGAEVIRSIPLAAAEPSPA